MPFVYNLVPDVSNTIGKPMPLRFIFGGALRWTIETIVKPRKCIGWRLAPQLKLLLKPRLHNH